MKIKGFLLASIAVMLLQPVLFSQTLYNNGVVIKVTKGATLYVDGVVQNQTGTIDVDNVSGTSVLIAEDDFINNATLEVVVIIVFMVIGYKLRFYAGTGTVFLEGGATITQRKCFNYFLQPNLNTEVVKKIDNKTIVLRWYFKFECFGT
jgi:hypothetical protein